MYVAAVDGALHPKEDAFLHDVARRFGFSHSEFRFFRARFVADHGNPYDVLRLSPAGHQRGNQARSTASWWPTTIPTS